MECPVCNAADLSKDELRCPKCNSDLEALHLSGELKNDNRNRLSFGIAMSVLFLAVLIVWIFTGMKSQTGNEVSAATPDELQQVKTELANEQNATAGLKSENEKLKKQLSDLQKQKKERTKEYIVQNGESLYTIARKIYGNGYKYVDIVKSNNIENPDRIRTGQKLIIHY